MAFKQQDIDKIRDIDPDSILAMLTGEVQNFTTIEAIIRWITRRYDKLIIPVMVLGVFVVMALNSVFVDPTPFFNLTIGQIIAGIFFVSLIISLLLLIFSSFILTMKAGKGKGNMKFNLRDKNADRLNEMEIDAIIKNVQRINRNTQRFQDFEGIINHRGELSLPDTDESAEISITTSFESLKGDPILVSIQKEVKEWEVDIPKADMPEFSKDNKKKDIHQYKVNPEGSPQQQALMTQEASRSVSFKRLAQQLGDDIDSRVLIREETPLSKFLDGSQDIYVHVIDFNNEFEYKKKKYPGIIFLHEKKTLQEIFPAPSKAFCMVGWTFGDIPVVTTEFIEIDKFKDIPIFYPTVTRDRLLMIANLGFYDEHLPSLKTVNACKNLVQLDISTDLLSYTMNLERLIATTDEKNKKVLRKGMGLYDRALNIHKKIHIKENKTMWALFLGLGFVIGFLAFPYADFIWRSFIQIIT